MFEGRANNSRDTLPVAVKEYESDGSTIKRLAIVTYHPEGFARAQDEVLSEDKQLTAFRERLIDYATIMVYGQVNMPTFLTTSNYIFNMRTGLLMPTQALYDYDDRNDTLSAYFTRPCSRGIETVQRRIWTNPMLQAKLRKLLGFIRKCRVEDKDSMMCSKARRWRRYTDHTQRRV
jgi:hypothetical protein